MPMPVEKIDKRPRLLFEKLLAKSKCWNDAMFAWVSAHDWCNMSHISHIYGSLPCFYVEDVHTSPLKEQNIQTRPNDYILSIKEIVNGVSVENEEKNYEATQSARKMLSRERNPPIDDVINVRRSF